MGGFALGCECCLGYWVCLTILKLKKLSIKFSFSDSKREKCSRGLMDKALASGAGDCGFESHRDRRFLVFSLKY